MAFFLESSILIAFTSFNCLSNISLLENHLHGSSRGLQRNISGRCEVIFIVNPHESTFDTIYNESELSGHDLFGITMSPLGFEFSSSRNRRSLLSQSALSIEQMAQQPIILDTKKCVSFPFWAFRIQWMDEYADQIDMR
jgi:hypothetical protein